MTRETELAWAAGFFDGEGCISFAKAGEHRQLIMCIGQNDPRVLERFKAAVGVGTINGPHVRPSRPNSKPYWQWRTSGHVSVQKTVELLWPYLDEVKRQQGRRSLDASTAHRKTLRWSGARTKLSEETRQEIRVKYNEGMKQSDLAREYGIAQTTVSNIVLGRKGRRRLRVVA